MFHSSKFISKLTSKVEEHVSKHFDAEYLNQIARLTGFNQRNQCGKINGSMFLSLVVFNRQKLDQQTLGSYSSILKERYDIEMKPQSINEKFNQQAVAFLRKIFEALIRERLHQDNFVQDFMGYNRVLLKDSTCFQVPSDLAPKYPGSGGTGTGAAVRIQFEYDILSGNINELSITAFNHQDASNAIETMDSVKPGDLIIRDLAYMHKKALQLLSAKRNAAYVSRLDTRVDAFEKNESGDFKKIDFVQVRSQMKINGIDVVEKTVYLGADKLHKTRLIVYALPEQIEQQQLRKLYKEAKRCGIANVRQESKIRAQLILMVTNESCKKLPSRAVYKLYKVRWQIELIFKAWKSVAGLAPAKKVKGERVECYFHGKLILILLGWNLIWNMMVEIYLEKKLLVSFYKAMKVLVERIDNLAMIMIHKKGTLQKYLQNYFDTLIVACKHETKKHKQNAIDIIISAVDVNGVNLSTCTF